MVGRFRNGENREELGARRRDHEAPTDLVTVSDSSSLPFIWI